MGRRLLDKSDRAENAILRKHLSVSIPLVSCSCETAGELKFEGSLSSLNDTNPQSGILSLAHPFNRPDGPLTRRKMEIELGRPS